MRSGLYVSSADRGHGSGRFMVGLIIVFFFQAEDGIRDKLVTGVQTCALPILPRGYDEVDGTKRENGIEAPIPGRARIGLARSEEHTSELQSLAYLVCRLLLEKKKKKKITNKQDTKKKNKRST